MADIRLETSQFDFLAKGFKAPKNFIYRIGVNGRRFYYEMINDYPLVYSSGTTLISDGYPDPSNALEEWKVKMRVMGEDPTAYMNYRADYGTILHILYGDFLGGEIMDLDKLGDYITVRGDHYISESRIVELVSRNLEEFKKDMLSFAQWVKDYNVEPLAIEMMISSKIHLVATAIDLVCKLDVDVKGFHGEVYKSGANKGLPKETKKTIRVTAIVDFKSGKKGFYDKHAIQLLLNKEMMEENYPSLTIDRIFNFSPKEWRSEPTYNFKDQTDNKVLNELPEILSMGKKRHLKKSKRVKIFSGTLSMGKVSDFDSNHHYNNMDLEEYIVSYVKQVKSKKK